MVSIICSNSTEYLEKAEGDFLVLLYGSPNNSPSGFSIGNTCKNLITHLDLLPDQNAFDFLTIALSVIAADTFILRDVYGSDGFARSIALQIAVASPKPWQAVKAKLEKTLNFLTGDSWCLDFVGDGERAPAKYEHKHLRTFNKIHKADSACLFSGGLDSFIGASLLQKQGRTPVLVSRSSTGDQKFQNEIAALLPDLPRFVMNDSPQSPSGASHEISTRARSFLFLAMGALICSSLSKLKGGNIPLIVPENGFIALNPPLTKKRIGANSTRTAHPHYIASIQSILSSVGIPATLENPFCFMTKGEMLLDSMGDTLVKDNAEKTVSCGHWKRVGMQCGRCWPCLIRRSSFFKAGLNDTTEYKDADLSAVLAKGQKCQDLKAVLYAIHHFDKNGRTSSPIRSMRNIPSDKKTRQNYMSVVERGFEELREFLFEQGVWS